jgi:hypothetical protein
MTIEDDFKKGEWKILTIFYCLLAFIWSEIALGLLWLYGWSSMFISVCVGSAFLVMYYIYISIDWK